MTSVDDVLQNLKNSDHIRLIAPHSSSFVVFIPGNYCAITNGS